MIKQNLRCFVTKCIQTEIKAILLIQICTQILHRGTGHVISRMRYDDLHWTGTLEPNISKTLGDRDLVPMEHQ